MTEALSPFEVKAALSALPGWEHDRDGGFIHRRVRTESFATAFTLAARIAMLAERMDHHPEVTVAWGRLDIVLSTHEPRGITGLDLRMAEEISGWLGGG